MRALAIRGRALAAAACFVATACAARVHPALEVAPAAEPRQAWARVLTEFVDERGRIDFEGLRAAPRDLEDFVAWIGTVSPDAEPAAYPDFGDQAVYWIDAFNALAMYSVVAKDARPERRYEFERYYRFLVGGEWMCLKELREDHLLALGDERVLFALNDMSRGAPRLWREPLMPRRIDVLLDARAREFFEDEKYAFVRYDVGTVYFSRLLSRHIDLFLALDPNLALYANRYRESKLLARTFVRFLEDDWELNAQ